MSQTVPVIKNIKDQLERSGWDEVKIFETWFEKDIPLQYALAMKLTPELRSWFSKTKELVRMMLRFTPEYPPDKPRSGNVEEVTRWEAQLKEKAKSAKYQMVKKILERTDYSEEADVTWKEYEKISGMDWVQEMAFARGYELKAGTYPWKQKSHPFRGKKLRDIVDRGGQCW